jgi:hypothetical protein
MAAEQKLAALNQLFKDSAVPDEMAKYLVDSVGAKTIDDFLGLVPSATYETDLKTDICDVAGSPGKDKILVLSRDRTAYGSAMEMRYKERKRRQENVQEDLDLPLDSNTHESFLASFTANYRLTLTMYLHPSDTLLGRLHRENQRTSATVIAIKRVKSLQAASLPQSQKEVSVGQLRILTGEIAEASIDSVFAYYMGLRILGNGYAIVGQHVVHSKTSAGEKVMFSPLSANFDYADMALRRTMEMGLPSGQQLDWIRSRDEQCRAEMVQKMRQGWSQGEALEKAIQFTEVSWTLKSGPRSDDDHARGSGKAERAMGSPGKFELRTGSTYQNKTVCKAWNDNRGCKSSEKDCPQRRLHMCDIQKGDGSICGSRSHTRGACPSNPKRR